MTHETGLPGYISRAEAHVHEARQSWDPASLSGCEQCAGYLQKAIDEMNAVQQAAGREAASPGTRGRLIRLRNEVEVLSRLVDSAMAFSRGLAWRTASEETVYSELKG